MNIVESAFGLYMPAGNPMEADCIIGHSFGTVTEDGSVNAALAEQMLGWEQKIAGDVPLIADQMLVDAFPEDERSHIALSVGGEISDTLGTRGGTWGVLLEARDYMLQHNLRRPMMLGHAGHIGRVARQAKKVESMPETIIPSGLPKHFDRNSDQPWTRSRALWVPREVIGSLVLRAKGQL